jgi:hypothetical protein
MLCLGIRGVTRLWQMFKFSDDSDLWCVHFSPSGPDVNNLNRDLLCNNTLIKYLSCSFFGDKVNNLLLKFQSEIYVTLGCGQFDPRDHDLNKRSRRQLENAKPWRRKYLTFVLYKGPFNPRSQNKLGRDWTSFFCKFNLWMKGNSV